jgi:hypothetical protein
MNGNVKKKFAYFPTVVDNKFIWLKNYYEVHCEKLANIGGVDTIVDFDCRAMTMKEGEHKLNQLSSQ